jgi:hypothetical protein
VCIWIFPAEPYIQHLEFSTMTHRRVSALLDFTIFLHPYIWSTSLTNVMYGWPYDSKFNFTRVD